MYATPAAIKQAAAINDTVHDDPFNTLGLAAETFS
jgi:hypothetical protein